MGRKKFAMIGEIKSTARTQKPAKGHRASLLPVCAFLSFVLLLLAISCAAAAPFQSPTPRADWRIDLIAQAPEIRYPSVVCAAPDGRVFVAEDPMDITLPAHTNAGRILCFHPDGRRTLFAEHLYAAFGMQYLEGKLYVLHNPRFSVSGTRMGLGQIASS